MEEAIHLEVERQIELIEDGGEVIQETRLYNGETRTARSMRSKEEANDYRYFPCPDLLPVVVTDKHIQQLKDQLPELPDARQERFVSQYELTDYDANVLGIDAKVAGYFEQTAQQSGNAKLSANWVAGELSARLNAENIGIDHSPVAPEQLAGLIKRIADNSISGKMAKQVFEAIWAGEGDADEIIEARGLKQVSDSGILEAMVDEVLNNNKAMVEDYISTDPDKRKKNSVALWGR